MRQQKIKILLLAFLLLFSTFGLIHFAIGSPLITSRTYTLDADFDEGVLIGVEHDTIHNQLQLSEEKVTLPFIWVPNLGEGSVSKVNTETGEELGRYLVAPFPTCSPSRTTVDLEGNCWVGNRDAGTAVKIGLYEAGNWIDRNGNGICDTSTGSTPLPWGQDECVLFEVVLIRGKEATYDPGPYDPINNPGGNPGIYDLGHWSTSPRGLAIDEDNNLWVGTYYPCSYYYIDDDTGAILRIEPFYNYITHMAYGAVIDENGILWSTGRPTGSYTPHIIRYDPDRTLGPGNPEKIYFPGYRMSYGLGLDYLGHIFASGWTENVLHRLDVNRPLGAPFPSSPEEWSKTGVLPSDDRYWSVRGVTCTADNDVWLASTEKNVVYRFYNNGTLKARIPVGNGPTGVSVDANGKVWVCNLNDITIQRIDNNSNSVDMTVPIVGSGGHYSYSDMTGIMARTITTKVGTWTVIFDSEELDTPWGKISWNSLVPEGTSLAVKVRSSNDQISWSSWETASNDVILSSTPNGQYLQIETTFQTNEEEITPILYDLTATIGIIPATVDFNPNTLNQKSKGNWVTVFIEFPDGYDINNIDVSTIMLNDIIPAEMRPIGFGDEDDDGIPDLMVKFNRLAVIDLLDSGEMVYIIITGDLLDGTSFRGTDIIRVIH